MFQNKRPIIFINKGAIDSILDYTSLVIILFIWGFTSINYKYLPDIIPTHFNSNGVVDDYGSKNTIWILPVIVTAVFILFAVINKFPHQFNYMVKITPNNAEKQYRLATRMMRVLQFNISILFTCIIVKVVRLSVDKNLRLEWWLIPLLLLSIIIPTMYMVIVSGSKKMR